jgi:hypothetical protein
MPLMPVVVMPQSSECILAGPIMSVCLRAAVLSGGDHPTATVGGTLHIGFYVCGSILDRCILVKDNVVVSVQELASVCIVMLVEGVVAQLMC